MFRLAEKLLLVALLFLLFLQGYGQDKGALYGKITTIDGEPIYPATVAIQGESIGTLNNEQGEYVLEVPANKDITVVFSFIGYAKEYEKINIPPGGSIRLDKQLKEASKKLDEVRIRGSYDREHTMMKINTKEVENLPSLSNEIISTIKTLPGVSSSSELSSQYSVRGGNFDENLVYVNDIEIYRPLLIRSGQQEGLDFINSDMVSSVKFSAGGFEPRYGDKMSSVLDVSYRTPDESAGSATMSLLGGKFHLEGVSEDGRFSHITGFRYKTSQYLLSTLEQKGEYKPTFLDLQTYMAYDLSNELSVSFLGNLAQNRYKFIPKERETAFGTLTQTLNLKVYYDGNEDDRFETYMGAFTFDYHPTSNLTIKFINSAYRTLEQESYDIKGQYLINEMNLASNPDHYTDSVMNIGIGTFLNHARNNLDAQVYSSALNGFYYYNGQDNIKWGIKYQYETIEDYLREWELLDSAGYTLPYSDTSVVLNSVVNADNFLASSRFTSYIQNTSFFPLNYFDIKLTGGLRTHYWNLNNQFLLSPRVTASLNPHWERDMTFNFSTGYYYQVPFYKELRDPDGKLNKDIKAQKSLHFVFGSDYIFEAWGRPFKLMTDVYYKHLNNIIPYKIKNVRVWYSAENNAKGFATGLDMRVNGEFVEGTESWASLSLMRTMADIKDDEYVDAEGQKVAPGYYPRPTDQFLRFGMFFQDYFPKYPSIKVNMTFMFGTGLPFSPPNDNYHQKFRMQPYRRVDIGVSKMLMDKNSELRSSNPFSNFESVWIGLEIFNLLDIRNTVSYTWFRTISSEPGVPDMFAVPNYLTSRRFNVKLVTKF
jgi:hypothetical protein